MLAFNVFVPESPVQPIWSSCLSVGTGPLLIKFPEPGGTNWYLFDEEVKPEGMVTQIRNIKTFITCLSKIIQKMHYCRVQVTFSDNFFSLDLLLCSITLFEFLILLNHHLW